MSRGISVHDIDKDSIIRTREGYTGTSTDKFVTSKAVAGLADEISNGIKEKKTSHLIRIKELGKEVTIS